MTAPNWPLPCGNIARRVGCDVNHNEFRPQKQAGSAGVACTTIRSFLIASLAMSSAFSDSGATARAPASRE